jgi:hypothetical protein
LKELFIDYNYYLGELVDVRDYIEIIDFFKGSDISEFNVYLKEMELEVDI